MQHYLRPDLLEAAGITDFDSWAATFGQTVTQIEMAPEGGDSFRQKTRFARFTNVPEMLRRWHVSADIKTGEDLKLPVPALARAPADGQRAPETVITQPSTRSSTSWPSSASGPTPSATGRSCPKKTTCSRSAPTAARPPSTCACSACP